MSKDGCVYYRSGNPASDWYKENVCPTCQDCWVKNISSEDTKNSLKVGSKEDETP